MPKGSEELTNARKEEIICACAALYQTMSFKEITMKEIGAATSFTRTSIYNYFQTKEEIFLALLQQEYERWITDLNEIAAAHEMLTEDELAGELAGSLERRALLLKLMSMNHYDMEENSRPERLMEFKVAYGNSIRALDRLLIKFRPEMDHEDRQQFLYTNVINWLAASNATVYQPLKNLSDDTQGRQNKYFSPRRQGAGMVNVEKVINSKVALHNSVPYNADTGEAPRTKVELGDKLGNSFTFSFVLENYNDEARIFDVLSCLQTDATTDNAGRSIIKNVSSNGRITSNDGSDIDPIKDAVITVDSVSSGATITSPSANINRYEELYSAPAKITVPAKSSTTVTVKVELNESTMAKYEKTFPNGMFLEGYVFFESEEHENVNIPFLGFRGDWTQAPIFDTKTIYDELPASTTDPDYPFYYATAMASTVPGEGDSKDEIFLGVNQYTDTAWGGYYRSNPYNQLRSYFQTIRLAGGLKGDFSAISPNGDGYADIAYANLTPLRNVKALYVEIKDENGNVIRTMGPEFEYFKVRSDDGNLTQQVAATYGTKYLRDMDWDGKKDDGTVAPDGQYTYNVYGITEKEFLENPAYALGENTWDKEHHTMTGMTPEYKAKVLAALKASETKDSVSMPVKVDTAKPVLRAGITADGKWTVSVSDKESGVQALAFYYDGEMIGEPTLVNQADYSVTLDISEALSEMLRLLL